MKDVSDTWRSFKDFRLRRMSSTSNSVLPIVFQSGAFVRFLPFVSVHICLKTVVWGKVIMIVILMMIIRCAAKCTIGILLLLWVVLHIKAQSFSWRLKYIVKALCTHTARGIKPLLSLLVLAKSEHLVSIWSPGWERELFLPWTALSWALKYWGFKKRGIHVDVLKGSSVPCSPQSPKKDSFLV